MAYANRFSGTGHKPLTFPLVIRGGVGSGTLTDDVVLEHKDSQFIALDPGGASRTVTLPAGRDGALFVIRNTADAAELLTVLNPAAATLAKIPPGRAATFGCDGATWRVLDAPFDSVNMVQHRVTQTIDMADAQVALVYGTAGAGEVQLTAELLLVDANSGATEDLLLPPEATSFGVLLFISNTGGEDIVVKEDSDSTIICTISTAESAFVMCDGTTWRGGVVKAT